MTTGITGYNPNSTIYNGLKAVAANHSNDVGNLVKFVQGEPMQGVPDATLGSTVLWTLPAMTVFGGVKGVPWLVQNRHDLKGAAAALRTEALAANGKNIPKNFATGLTDYTTKLFKGLTPAEKAALAAKPRSWFGKMLDMIPGYKKLRPTGFGQAMGRSGAGFMIAAEGLMSTFTEVVPAFQQGGAKSGFKQIAKSGTKVAANAAGWIAGEAIGSAAGMRTIRIPCAPSCSKPAMTRRYAAAVFSRKGSVSYISVLLRRAMRLIAVCGSMSKKKSSCGSGNELLSRYGSSSPHSML